MRRLARLFLVLCIAAPVFAAAPKPVIIRAQTGGPVPVKINPGQIGALPKLVPSAVPALNAGMALPALKPIVNPLALDPDQAGPRDGMETALERLQADFNVERPKAADMDGQKEWADRAFDFKLNGVDPEAGSGVAGTGGGNNINGNNPPPDDGGGPNYPFREIRYNGRVFPSVLFRPNVPAEPEIVKLLDSAKTSIRLAAYEFKSRAMLEALYRARARGVDVQIVLDHSNVFPRNEPGDDYQKKRSWEIWRLIKDGFDVTVLRGDGQYGIMHNKFIVVDSAVAEYGSYNYTWASEEAHYENVQFTDEKRRVKALDKYWDYLRGLSKPVPEARDYQWPRGIPVPSAPAFTVDLNGVKLPGMMLQPNVKFEDVMVAAIGAVKKTLDVSIFALRSTRIAEAIVEAKERGAAVRVIIDKSQHDSDAFGVYTQWLAAKGVEVRVLAGPDPHAEFQLAQKDHHKIAIFDGKVVETGSPNYTKYAARNNFENGHFLDDKTDVAAYNFIFEHMWRIADSYAPPSVTPALPSDEELTRDAEKDPPPIDWPKKPQLPQLPPAKELKYNGETFPSSALLPEVPILPLIRKAIQSSKKSIRLAIYEFNLEEMLSDLRDAKKRGVKIEIVLNRSHVYVSGKGPDRMTPRKPTPQIVALIQEGFDVLLLKGERSGIQHNKIGIFDDKLLMGGSFNFTGQSEFNHYENMTFTTDKAEVRDVIAYFKYMRGLAEAVDHDRLDEILNRGLDFEAADAKAEPADDGRDSRFPPPPLSKAKPVDFNGVSLRRYYFSPQGGIEKALISAIRAAKTSVDIAMFSFYSRNIADALFEARERGVAVRLVLDQSQAGLAKLDNWFAFHGFDMVLLAGPNDAWEEIADPKYEKMHHKFMLVDGALLFNGSFNYSPNAENNSFEHVRLIEEPLDLARFIEAFARMFARGFKPKPPKEEPTWDTKSLSPEQLIGAE